MVDKISQIFSPDYFKELCDTLFSAEYDDFQTIDDSAGDGGNDGYSESKEILFQLYCPKKPRTSDGEYKKKIKKDLEKAKKLADSGYKISTWIFVTPAKLRQPVQTLVREEAKKYGFTGIAWSGPKLSYLLSKHSELRPKFSHLFEAEIEKIVNQIKENQDTDIGAKEEYKNKVNAKYKKRIDEARDILNDGNAGGAKKLYVQIISEMEEEKTNIDKHLFFRAVNNLGNCEQNLGNHTEAVSLFREAITYSPEDKIGKINQAVAFLLEDKNEKALELLEKLSDEYGKDKHFITVKANTLKSLGKYENLYNFLKESGESKLLLTFKGIEMMEAKREVKAIEYFEKVLEIESDDEQAMLWASQCVLMGFHDKLKNESLPEHMMDSDLKAFFQKAVVWLEHLAGKYSKVENHPYCENIFINLAGAYIALGSYEKALDAVNEAISVNKTSIVAYQNKSICELKMGRYQDCIESTEKYIDYGGTEKKLATNIIFCALKLKENNLAEKHLANLLEDNGVLDLDVAELAIELYSNKLEIEKIQSLLSRITDEYPNDAQALRIRANYLIETGLEGAEKLLIEAVENSTTPLEKMLSNVDLSDYYVSIKEYNKASNIYKNYIDNENGRYVTVRYARALYKSGKLGELLNWITCASESIQKNQDILVLEAHANLDLGNLEKAASQFKELYSKNNEISYLVNYGLCEIRQNNNDVAKVAYDVARRKASTVEEWLPLSQGYASLGDWDSAVELAYKSYEKSPEDAGVVKSFMYSVLFAEQATGKKIDDKYVKSFQKAISEFSEKFPNDTGLKSIKIEEGDITPILEMVKEISEVTGKAQQMYSDSTVPISFVSNMTGKNPIDVWFAFISKENVGIKAALGNAEERHSELSVLDETLNKAVVIDLHPLLLLGYLDKLNLLDNVGKKFFVHQSLIDLLNDAVHERVSALKKGVEIMGYVNGQYQMVRAEPEVIQKSIDLFKKIIAFVRESKNIEIRGFEHEVDKLSEKIINKMHYSTRDSATLAKQINASFYTDDKLLKGVIKREEGIDSFSTHNFFNYLWSKGVVDTEEFYNLTKEILELNYEYISVDSKMIYYHLKKSNYSTKNLEVFSKQLAKKETTLSSLVSVLADFLLILLSDPEIDQINKKTIFRNLVEPLGSNHDINKLKEGLLVTLGELVELEHKKYVQNLVTTALK